MPAVEFHRDVPGYAEAARREEDIRAVPFLGLDERIAGLPAASLTLRRVQWLTMVRSPFLLKVGTSTLLDKPNLAADIILFLWIVSPKFEAGNERAKKRFYKSHGGVMKQDAVKVVTEILEYVEEAFLDAAERDRTDDPRSYYSTAAGLVGFFHQHYGLQVDVWENSWARRMARLLTGQPNVLDIPLKIAFQLIRVHQKSVNPEMLLHNRLTQPCVDKWLTELNRN